MEITEVGLGRLERAACGRDSVFGSGINGKAVGEDMHLAFKIKAHVARGKGLFAFRLE